MRKYISVYWPAGSCTIRKKQDLTISFSDDDPLFHLCKKLTSQEIRELIGINSYDSLVHQAESQDRKPGNYIKHILRKKLVK